MKLQTYAGFSFLATIMAIYYAFSSRGQFYPAMVYLSTSKICFVLLLNTGLVIMCIMWQLVKRLFLGSLREAEVERLNEQSWREVMEILFAVTIFRQDFSVTFLAMVTALLLIKALHWLAQKRVEYIETTPSVPILSHMRIVSFMGFLLVIDCLFLSSSLKSLIRTRQASVALFFLFEYTILATTTVSTFVKYVFYVSDMLMEGQWERKAVYTFYLELVRDLLHLSLYIFFFLVIFVNYGIPLHLIRELYETFRNFRIRIADYIRYRKITSNMNERFPDATPEELNASDATCIICREEMVTAKKLLCGHLFHVHCLRSWLERQHTCPTCRALVVPPENRASASRRQHGGPSESRQNGPAATGLSPQPSDGGAAGENISHLQAKLQAAALAASAYEKSFVYPPTNTFYRPSGYPLRPQTNVTQMETPNNAVKLSSEHPNTNGQSCHTEPSQLNGHPSASIPFQAPESSGSELQVSLLKAQENYIRSQIELLETQLKVLQHQQKVDQGKLGGGDGISADCKGKAVLVSNTPAFPDDCGHHAETEDADTD
ncbi:ERAD-associated E3 ubiquitin-protein ligase HRD1-like [Ananas comosus]|uniref:RING-type E3 ubiquitin transferase n=1 Tax=Ananas comosus TaxID=4615 RepID=A0A6P5EIJ8_ANACO|nr:ERAD-associated E3 ubiquitin-protein ligase HRD1-like [Ananas comosus]